MVTPVRTSAGARWRRLALLITSLAVALGTAVLAAPAAQAQPAARDGVATAAAGMSGATPRAAADLGGPVAQGPNGNCPVQIYATKVWGWCDGTGPERYRIYVYCTDGRYYGSSATPWFGDRRGAWAYCPSGSYASFAGWWYA